MDDSAINNASRGSKKVGYRINPLLVSLSWPYSLLIRARNWYYDRRHTAVRRAGVPVISVGNITTGGTGKTPLVIEIVQRLKTLGRKPAILTRGYGAAAGETADEVLEFRESLPDVPVVVNPDRVAGAKTAQQEHQADCLVLDDGFQHRRLHRDLNIVVIDALNPWGGGALGGGSLGGDMSGSDAPGGGAPASSALPSGAPAGGSLGGGSRSGGRLLPAGRLREPLSGLRRADLFVISRANQVEPAVLREIRAVLQRHAPAAPVITARIEVAGWRLHGAPALDAASVRTRIASDGSGVQQTSGQSVDLPASSAAAHAADTSADTPTGRRLLPVCGIGNPATFLRLLETWAAQSGATLVPPLVFADHHRYGVADGDRIRAAAQRQGADWVVTTRKDWVKLAALWPQSETSAPPAAPENLRLCRLDIRLMLDDPQGWLGAALAKAVEPNKNNAAFDTGKV